MDSRRIIHIKNAFPELDDTFLKRLMFNVLHGNKVDHRGYDPVTGTVMAWTALGPLRDVIQPKLEGIMKEEFGYKGLPAIEVTDPDGLINEACYQIGAVY